MTRLEIGHSPAAVAAAMFAAVFVVRLSIGDATSGVSLLYSIPILLLTIAYGIAGGVAAATFALALVGVWMQISAVELGTLGLLMRALGFYAVPCTVWLARPRAAPVPDPPAHTPAVPRPLTPRESEVLGLLAAGHTNAQIAAELVLSVRTVESHRASLQRKLGRPSRAELTQYALRQGLTVYSSRSV